MAGPIEKIPLNEDGTKNLITTGLEAFGCMEIEIISSRKESTELLNLGMAAADMLLHGEQFSDGDTMGFDEKTKIKTTHETSVWEREGKVLRIHL